MKVTISSSSCEHIDEVYFTESKKALEYLAENDFDLNWGSASIGLMGLCYRVFLNENRLMSGYTSPKYADDISNLPKADHRIYKDTFELKSAIYNDADLVLCLPGGTGTISEFFSYLEEARSNDNVKPIVLYNINHHFDLVINLINELVEKKFNSDSINNYFVSLNSFEEFKEYIDNIIRTR